MSRLQTIADKLLTYATNRDMTSTQVDNATWPQVKTQLGEQFPERFSHAELQKVKRIVVLSLLDTERRAIKDAIKSQLTDAGRVWLQNVYPDCAFDHRFENGKLCVELWPHGKPEDK